MWVSMIHWAAYSIYFRTLTYFSVANPCIYLGGMLDERKTDIYELVPEEYLPKTIMYEPDDITSVVLDVEENFEYPIIAKPNVGFRGFLVHKIDTREELENVVSKYKGKELLIQEFLTESREYSVMFYDIKNEQSGISSLVEKHFPGVTGDGVQSLRQLIEELDNPFLNIEWVLEKNKKELERVLEKDQYKLIDHIGNYNRGSKFVSLNESIDQELVTSIRSFFKYVPGMHFCRLDVKATSLQALKAGNFKLLEINGAKSEPLHIYDTDMTYFGVIKATRQHWKTLFRIVKKDIQEMVIPSSMEGIRSYFSLRKMVSESQ